MEIVSLVITPVVQSLMVPIKKHLGFLVSSTKYVKDMNEKMGQLNITEKDIRHKRDQALERNHEVSHHVSPWLEKVQKMNEKTKSIPTGGIGCFSMLKRYRAGNQSYNVLEEIQALEKLKSEIKFTEAEIPLAVVASTSTGPSTSNLGGTHNNFKSRDLIYKAALESLQSNDESQKMIALCGMGGVGKTTMMEQLKKELKSSNSFDRVVKVVLGENYDPIALQRAIAKNIKLGDLKEETKDARADRLGKIFEEMEKQGKKTLVIMDDLWKAFDLKDVGLSPLPSGFKLLFTSRDGRLCTIMGVKHNSIFTVGVLNDAEAKRLFFENVDDGDNHPLQKVGEGIVKKCRGLPIAIVTIAKSLSDNIEEAWKKALWRLEKHDLEDLESITHRIFEMSYENLKKDDDKSVFLLSGLFPDDFDIRIEDLLRFGWGLGFFKDAKKLATARSDMKICVSNLIRANLLTESDRMGCYRVHDLVRAFVLNKISEVKQASIVNDDNKSEQDGKESYDRILLKCTHMTKFPEDFNYPNLSLLVLMDMNKLLKFPEDFYERMEKLQVVSYENMSIPSLLLTFEQSNKLRTLCLRSCSLINDDITFLGSLSNLETLSFVDCKISRLPSTIGKLKKLKLLDLTGCVQLRIDNGVFENLGRLEELYMRANSASSVRFTDANCDELEVLSHQLFALELEFFQNKAEPKNVSFKTLERFRISISCQLVKLNDDEKYSFRNTIQFVGDYNELLESKISDLFNRTEDLYLEVNNMSHLEDISFCYLTALHVSECVDLTCLFTYDVASALNKLERLKISECRALRTLVAENSRVGVIKFQKLNFMCLTSLPKMVSFWDNVIELPEMVELILDDLPNFTSIYPQTHNNSEMQSLLNKKVVIPKLERLAISTMMKLKQIWSCETTIQENNISMLRKISVRNCDNLINLFPCNPLPLLSNLEELDVEKCGSIEVLFNIDFESVSRVGESNMSRLKSIKVDELGKLKELWRMKGVNKSDILISCFKGVEDIEIRNCSIFKHIFTPTTSNFDLEALTNYIILNSGKKINATLKGETSEIDESIPNVTYPSYLLHTCHRLQYLVLRNDEGVEEVVFEMDSQPPLLLPYLKHLGLYDLKEMIHVWTCNWNKFLIPQHKPFQFPFQNLTNISVSYCHKIKYLFSPLMAKFLSSLKDVCIEECDGIKEVVLWRDDECEENTSNSSEQNTTFFPCLERLVLGRLALLHRVDTSCSKVANNVHHQSQSSQVNGAFWSLCQYPRTISIYECHALSSVIPWYALGQMKRLEELYVRNCERMLEVCESKSSTISVDEGSTSLTCSNITNIVVPQLSNLKIVYIDGCGVLSHVFTFSTLESLKQLKELTVKKCKEIQVVIVIEENMTSLENVVFPRLETLVLDDLPSLKGFFLGMNEFRWPSLEYVMINDCPQLMMFTAGESKTPKLKYIHTRLGKHSLECGLNFHGMINELQTTSPSYADLYNLIEIQKSFEDVGETIIPSHALPQLQKLQPFHIESSMANDVYEVVALEGSGFNESQIVVKIPNLTQVKLQYLHNLKYLWKSNQLMVLEFPNLTEVSIISCRSLEHVFTYSMVGSLVQLKVLHISGCRDIEVIVKEKEEEEERDDKVNEIMLPCLKALKLYELPSLKAFFLGKDDFSWPSLDTLEVRDCPSVTVFTKGYLSTPGLKVIDTSFGKYYVKVDLNSFIKTKQEEGYEF